MADKTQYTPPEADIARVLQQTGSDPRKLAVAYLRAQRRAQELSPDANAARTIRYVLHGGRSQ